MHLHPALAVSASTSGLALTLADYRFGSNDLAEPQQLQAEQDDRGDESHPGQVEVTVLGRAEPQLAPPPRICPADTAAARRAEINAVMNKVASRFSRLYLF